MTTEPIIVGTATEGHILDPNALPFAEDPPTNVLSLQQYLESLNAAPPTIIDVHAQVRRD